MKLIRPLAAFLLALALSLSIVPQSAAAASGPSKWFHHQKKSPNQSKVHHAKPTHHPKPTHHTSKQRSH
jgi:Spy/CpxP family protein refolding chaperone